MNLFLNYFNSNFGVETIVVTFVITVISILIELIFKDKLPAFFKTLLPFALGVTGFFIYNLIAKKFPLDFIYILSFGMVSATLSLILKSFISNFKGLKTVKSVFYLLVKEILNDYYLGEKLEEITLILSDYLEGYVKSDKNLMLFEGLSLKLKEVDGDINDKDLKAICFAIESAYLSLNKIKN